MSEVLGEGRGLLVVRFAPGVGDSLMTGGAIQITAGTRYVSINGEQAGLLRDVLNVHLGPRLPANELAGELLAFASAYRGDAVGVTEHQRRQLLAAAAQLAGLLSEVDTDE